MCSHCESQKEACGCGSESCACSAEGSSCGSEGCGCGGFERKVYSTAEKIEWMKSYQKELELELTAVKEKIAHLEKIEKE